MVKKEVFEKIGEYDEKYFIPYEDSDFSIRAIKAGFKNYATSFAKAYHQGIKKTFINKRLEWLGITSTQRAYYTMRNKLIFMRKHSPFPKNFFFFLVLTPLYLITHTLIISSTFRFDVLFRYWLGTISGIFYVIFYPLYFLRDWYWSIDKKLDNLKILLLAWTDPLPWIIDKKSKTILDLGCGQGKPMELIKKRMRVGKAVGVDLFEPYINQARGKKIHDEYIIKDIKKINFKPKSFDIVIASHVLEHMTKQEALKVLGKMERIARRQVLVATPIGEMYHPPVDNNPLQLHKSHFLPSYFEKRGYSIVKYGWRWLLGDKGLVHRVQNDLVKKLLYTFNILATPIYYLFQPLCDYIFVAYKKLDDESFS